MDGLDKKLGDILIDAQRNNLYGEDFVKEVKQAFVEAGYVQVPTVNEVDNKLYIQNGMGRQVFFDGSDKRLMSGQEWYNRFVENLKRDGIPLYDTKAKVAYAYENVVGAAKKVAGIEG